jgi:hypothetical protein
MDITKGKIIRYKRLVGNYIVTDLSLLRSDAIVGAMRLDQYPGGPVRYEPTSRVEADR